MPGFRAGFSLSGHDHPRFAASNTVHLAVDLPAGAEAGISASLIFESNAYPGPVLAPYGDADTLPILHVCLVRQRDSGMRFAHSTIARRWAALNRCESCLHEANPAKIRAFTRRTLWGTAVPDDIGPGKGRVTAPSPQ